MGLHLCVYVAALRGLAEITQKGIEMTSVSHMFKAPAVLLSGIVVLVLVSMSAGSGFAADGKRSGAFQGRSGHATSGSVTVTKTGGGATLTLGSNFSLDGAPDPWIGFGKGGKFIKATRFSKLKKNSGRQTYQVPASIDLDGVSEVYIYCVKFSVPLGVARLN